MKRKPCELSMAQERIEQFFVLRGRASNLHNPVGDFAVEKNISFTYQKR
jgi:hypothetical protein